MKSSKEKEKKRKFEDPKQRVMQQFFSSSSSSSSDATKLLVQARNIKGLENPTDKQWLDYLLLLYNQGLLKVSAIGQAFTRRVKERTTSSQYNRQYFNTKEAFTLAYGISCDERAIALEQSAINFMEERSLSTNKNKAGIPRKGSSKSYNEEDPGTVYCVPLHSSISLEHFRNNHSSYYKLVNGGGGLRKQKKDARSLGTDAVSLGTDARSLGTDKFSLGTDKFSLGTDARSLGTDARSLGTKLTLYFPLLTL